MRSQNLDNDNGRSAPPRGGRPAVQGAQKSTTYFYPRPPRGGRHMAKCARWRGSVFLSTPSARRATHHKVVTPFFIMNFYPRPPRGGRPRFLSLKISGLIISIHALREEGDYANIGEQPVKKRFLSTPSARRATKIFITEDFRLDYFYPRPPRGGRLRQHRRTAGQKKISIHALREEGDSSTAYQRAVEDIFLSTPSARRATAA